MAFFNDLIDNIQRSPSQFRPRSLGHASTVMAYAPRRFRPDAAEAMARAESEIAYWRERAFRAETRLRALETRVRTLASLAPRQS